MRYSSSDFLFLLAAFMGSSVPADITLTVLHTNDVHSRFLETSDQGEPCTEEFAKQKQCFGGFSRLHYKVKEIRASHKNVLYLSGGDYYQGTAWYIVYKWRAVSKFVNVLNHTAMAFGNHEFDDNIAGVVPFLEAAIFPIIASNIDDTKEPTMQGKYKKSIVVEIEDGRKVGIIGYITPETKMISNPGNITFLDIISSIKTEARKLNKAGVKILIALGHAGYDYDQKIAKEVRLLDAVVGAHSHTFLYHGKPPSNDTPRGDYPTVITQQGGRKVPVVQAYRYGKYLGYLNLTINDRGEVTKWNGNPILLDRSVPEDPTLLAQLKKWDQKVSNLTETKVGTTRVYLEGNTLCQRGECNLGNLMADAMVYAFSKSSDGWADVTMAILSSGSIRGSINEEARQGGVITIEDILSVMPFQNTVDWIEIKGKHLRQVFEFGVVDFEPTGRQGSENFLQVSGIKVAYNLRKPKNSRVKKIEVLCKDCRVPRYFPLNDTEVYKVAINSFLIGFPIIKNNLISHHVSGILDSDNFAEYIKMKSPITQAVEGRIKFESWINGCL